MWVIRLAVTGMAKNGRQVGHLFFYYQETEYFCMTNK